MFVNEQKLKELFGGSLKRPMDGMDIVYSDNVLYMALFYAMPNPTEISQFKQDGNLFYITVIEDCMYISMKIGDLNVAESSFHIKRQEKIIKIQNIPDTTTLSLCVVFVDSVFGNIKGTKFIKASDGFRTVFFKEAVKQLSEKEIEGKAELIMNRYNTNEIASKMNKESFFISQNT